MADRADYAFPLRIDSASRQGARAASYERHVAEMIRQVLLTSPGERVNLPDFGCGLRRILFGPNSDAVGAAAELLVRHSLERWLSQHVIVGEVAVLAGDASPTEGAVVVRVVYTLRETRETNSVEVRVA